MNAASLPGDREIITLCDMAMKAYQDETKEYFGLAITDHHEHARFLLLRLRRAVVWDKPRVKIHRDGVEVVDGGKIMVLSGSNPGMLMGLNPTEIVLFGQVGEMYYWMLSKGCEIRGVA